MEMKPLSLIDDLHRSMSSLQKATGYPAEISKHEDFVRVDIPTGSFGFKPTTVKSVNRTGGLHGDKHEVSTPAIEVTIERRNVPVYRGVSDKALVPLITVMGATCDEARENGLSVFKNLLLGSDPEKLVPQKEVKAGVFQRSGLGITGVNKVK